MGTGPASHARHQPYSPQHAAAGGRAGGRNRSDDCLLACFLFSAGAPGPVRPCPRHIVVLHHWLADGNVQRLFACRHRTAQLDTVNQPVKPAEQDWPSMHVRSSRATRVSRSSHSLIFVCPAGRWCARTGRPLPLACRCTCTCTAIYLLARSFSSLIDVPDATNLTCNLQAVIIIIRSAREVDPSMDVRTRLSPF